MTNDPDDLDPLCHVDNTPPTRYPSGPNSWGPTTRPDGSPFPDFPVKLDDAELTKMQDATQSLLDNLAAAPPVVIDWQI